MLYFGGIYLLIASILIGIIILLFIIKRSSYFLHIVQLEGYKLERYENWLKANRKPRFKFIEERDLTNIPLVYTNRAKRLNAMNIFINLLYIGILILIFTKLFAERSIYIVGLTLIIYTGLIYLIYLSQAYTMYLANFLILPIEERINRNFYNLARDKIANKKDLKVVGISGSYGKTNTKFILGTILEEKFNVLNTPETYNTTIGLSKLINNKLNEEHEIFIAELGARNIGDLRELARLVSPDIGVITSIGPTHLETFKNIDNIIKTKYELIEELPADGIAIYNADNEHINKLSQKTFKEKILYGLEDIENLDIFAKDIQVSKNGSTFIIADKEGNEISCRTKLLGKHNIYNILAGVSVARSLGLSFEEIKAGIGKIKPIAHNLNIINQDTGLIIIDDAYNSNPIGARVALDVLSEFKDSRKIIVTPGMVGLGAMEDESNIEFGENIGKECDYAILIGKERTKSIYEGLINSNFNEANILIAENSEQAIDYINKLAKENDVILFENDLEDKDISRICIKEFTQV